MPVPRDNLIGVVSGFVLFGLVLYHGIYQLLIPLIEDGNRYLGWTIFILVGLFLSNRHQSGLHFYALSGRGERPHLPRMARARSGAI